MIIFCLVFPPMCFGGPTSYNLGRKGSPITSDWWSSGRISDIGTNWAREIDSLIALGINPGTGKIWYVDSGVTNAGDGSNWLNALATTDAAINAISSDSGANRGDWIAVAQGHAESGTDPDLWDADVAGVTIWHLGNGSNQGTYTFADTDTTVSVGAANVYIYGGRLLAGISEVVIGMDVTADADYLTVDGMEFPEPTTSSFEFNIAVQLVTGADDVSFINCIGYSADEAGADHWLNGGGGVVNRLSLIGNRIHGEYAIAPIFSDQIDLENYIAYNTITQMTAGEYGIEYTAAATGILERNNVVIDDRNQNSIDPGSMRIFENYISDSADVAATLFNPPSPKIDEVVWAYFLQSVAGSAEPIKIWYVDANISSSGTGTTPETAFKTIQEAITACSNSVDDWIFVFDYSGGGATITMDKAFVHLIGNRGTAMPYPRIKPASAVAGITFAATGDRVEIAFLAIGGGDQTVPAISFPVATAAGAYGVYIHDNVIGRDADVPANDGIEIVSGGAAPYLRVENNRFYGVAMSGCDQSGIEISGNSTGGRIVGNYFADIGSSTHPAINLAGSVGNMQIQDNRIAGNDDGSAGWAITLSSNCTNIFVDGNHAASSDAASDASAFLDSASDEANAWGINYTDITADLP